MPQAYWAAIGGTSYAAAMVDRMNTEWRNWQNNLTGPATNAIKPIVPIGQGYNSGERRWWTARRSPHSSQRCARTRRRRRPVATRA